MVAVTLEKSALRSEKSALRPDRNGLRNDNALRGRSARFGPYQVSHIQHPAMRLESDGDNFGHPWRAVRMTFVLDGELKLQMGTHSEVVGPRCAALTVGWQPVKMETSGARVLEVDIAVERTQMNGFLKCDDLVVWPPETALPSATCAALRELLMQPGANDTVRNETTRVVDQLLTAVVTCRPEPEMTHECVIVDREHILEYVRAHHTNQELSPIRIANHFGISTRTLHRLFEGDTQTICGYLAEARINSALTQLRDRNMADATLEQIAELSGYGSALALRRAVLSATGKTPSEVRAETFVAVPVVPVADVAVADVPVADATRAA